jgi:hypothetical protein
MRVAAIHLGHVSQIDGVWEANFRAAARMIGEASIPVPLLGRNLHEGSIVLDPDLASLIRSAVAAFVGAIRAGSPHASS